MSRPDPSPVPARPVPARRHPRTPASAAWQPAHRSRPGSTDQPSTTVAGTTPAAPDITDRTVRAVFAAIAPVLDQAVTA